MRIGVFGGTFDPPHLGHLILAQRAYEQLGLDRVLFVPTGDPWRKRLRRVTAAFHRIAMTRLAAVDNPVFFVDDCEVSRAGATYTLDTLCQLNARFGPGTELVFIVGEDALADMPRWRAPAAIAAEAIIAVAPREGVELPPLPFSADRLVKVRMPYIGISSTELRARVGSGLSIRYQVPSSVEAYIRQHGLYRA